MVEAGIPVDDGRLPPELDDVDWLIGQEGITNVELARRLGVTPEAVSRARQRHGLRQAVPRSSMYPQLEDRSWLEERYHGRGMTQAQIAGEIGCARSAVALAMSRLGVKARPKKSPDYPELHDRRWLDDMLRSGRSPGDIAEVLGCHRTSVAEALKKHGLR